jgi:hypothetical protein
MFVQSGGDMKTPESNNDQKHWDLNRPVTLTQLAALMGVSYSCARSWGRDPAFPRFGRFIRRTDFESWWKQAARREAAQRKAATKPPPPPPVCSSQQILNALPPKAARLLSAA